MEWTDTAHWQEVDHKEWEAGAEAEVMVGREMNLETHLMLPPLSDLFLREGSEETRRTRGCGTNTLAKQWARRTLEVVLTAEEGEAPTLREVATVEAARMEVVAVEYHRV